jgi:hypothetical protein
MRRARGSAYAGSNERTWQQREDQSLEQAPATIREGPSEYDVLVQLWHAAASTSHMLMQHRSNTHIRRTSSS